MYITGYPLVTENKRHKALNVLCSVEGMCEDSHGMPLIDGRILYNL